MSAVTAQAPIHSFGTTPSDEISSVLELELYGSMDDDEIGELRRRLERGMQYAGITRGWKIDFQTMDMKGPDDLREVPTTGITIAFHLEEEDFTAPMVLDEMRGMILGIVYALVLSIVVDIRRTRPAASS